MLSLTLYEEIILRSPQAILLTDDSDIIRYLNPAALTLLGTDAVNMPLDRFIGDAVPEIVSLSTGVRLSAGTGTVVRTLTDFAQQQHTVAVYRNRHENRTIIFLKDISTETRYWEKLHRHKQAEDRLYRSECIRSGKLDEAIREIMVVASEAMQVKRCNIWQIDNNFQAIRSIGNYDHDKGFLPAVSLTRSSMPAYFDLLATEELITTSDSPNDKRTQELSANYIIPNGILSMMDVPVRIEGRMVGLICFEETKAMRAWDVAEQKFGLTIAQIIALTLETHSRQQMKIQLESALDEKKMLLREVNHRVKNNFDLISEVLRIQAEATASAETRAALEASRNRLLGMANIHRLFYQGEHTGQVSLRDFLLDVCAQVKNLFAADQITLTTLFDPVQVSVSKALLAGIIVNELLANAQKHAFDNAQQKKVSVQLQNLGNAALITVSDNGNGSAATDKTGQGITGELVTRLNGTMQVSADGGYVCKVRFPLK